MAERLGAAAAGERFVAVTDPGSALEATAREHGFRRVFPGLPDIGGRFSALSIDLAIPGRPYTFGTVEAAQARGDLAVLAERGRRLLRIHLSGDPLAALARLRKLVEAAL